MSLPVRQPAERQKVSLAGETRGRSDLKSRGRMGLTCSGFYHRNLHPRLSTLSRQTGSPSPFRYCHPSPRRQNLCLSFEAGFRGGGSAVFARRRERRFRRISRRQWMTVVFALFIPEPCKPSAASKSSRVECFGRRDWAKSRETSLEFMPVGDYVILNSPG